MAAIIVTQEYLHFAEQVVTNHEKANKQAELHVSAGMGDMLTDIQACLKQLCGTSTVGDAETVAKLIAEKMTAMNVCSDQADHDSQGEILSLPAPSPALHVNPILLDSARGRKRLKTNLMQFPALYDTTGSINTVRIAWDEWNSGPGGETIADRIKGIKADTSLAVGSRNSSLHKKNRHLPQLIESLINSGATAEEAISLMTQLAEHYELTIDQVREGARLLAIKTGKKDDDGLTAETAVIVGQFKQGIRWVHCQDDLVLAKVACRSESRCSDICNPP